MVEHLFAGDVEVRSTLPMHELSKPVSKERSYAIIIRRTLTKAVVLNIAARIVYASRVCRF